MGVFIQTPLLTMEIRIVPLEDLSIHEITIPSALERIKQEIHAEEVLRHPMIVDSRTLVVLDGMHRVAALRSLGCQLAPVCLVDYQNPAIELHAWYRKFISGKPLSKLIELIKRKTTYSINLSSISEVQHLVNTRTAFSAIASQTACYAVSTMGQITANEIYEEISSIEALANKVGFQIGYSTEPDAIDSLPSKPNPILMVPSLTKQEVVDSALRGELFIQKATRHTVPARPLFVRVPLKWLYESDSYKANAKMTKLLDRKQIVRLKSGAIIEGRRYEECAYVFKDVS
jgi:hypothetical protein